MDNLKQPSTYKEQVAQYTKKDAIYALLFAVIFMTLPILHHLLLPALLPEVWGGLIDVLMLVLLVALFVLVRKKGQGLRSIGLHLTGWKKAVAVGLILMLVTQMLLEGLLPGLLSGWEFRAPFVILTAIALSIWGAFFEDVIFIGFIQTRIYGLIKKDVLAIAAGAAIFAAVHYPIMISDAISANGGIGMDFWGSLALATFAWMMLYITMNIIFRRFSSIIPVTLFHFSWNLANGAFGGGFWENSDGGFNAIISFVIIFYLVLFVCVVWPWLKKRKAAKKA